MQKRKGILLAALACLFVVGWAGWFLTSAGTSKAEAAVLAANKTEIMFDGEKVLGLKGFTYKVYKDRQDVRGIGMNERIGVQSVPDFVWTSRNPMGKILVHSNSELLNKHMDNNTSVQIILSIMQDSYPEGLGLKTFTFDGCRIEGREYVNDVPYPDSDGDLEGGGEMYYTFTADRVREETIADPGIKENAIQLTFDGYHIDGISAFTVDSLDPEADKPGGKKKAAQEFISLGSVNLYTRSSAAAGTTSEQMENVYITSKGFTVEFDDEGEGVFREHHNFAAGGGFIDGVISAVVGGGITAGGGFIDGVIKAGEEMRVAAAPPEGELEKVVAEFADPEVNSVIATSFGVAGLHEIHYTVFDESRPDFPGLGNAYGRLRPGGVITVKTGSSTELVLKDIMDQEDELFELVSFFHTVPGEITRVEFDGCHVARRDVSIDAAGKELTSFAFTAKDIGVDVLTGENGIADPVGLPLPEPSKGTLYLAYGTGNLYEEVTSGEDGDLENFSYSHRLPKGKRKLQVYRRPMPLKGKILVHSNSELLNKHMDNNTHFQIILSIMQTSYPEGLEFIFDGVYCDDREFQIDSHGYALTTYTFTADRLREA